MTTPLPEIETEEHPLPPMDYLGVLEVLKNAENRFAAAGYNELSIRSRMARLYVERINLDMQVIEAHQCAESHMIFAAPPG